MGALVAGYVAFGLLFTYHYATHSYYHLPADLRGRPGRRSGRSGSLDRWWRRERSSRLGRLALGAAAVVLVVAGAVVDESRWCPSPSSARR